MYLGIHMYIQLEVCTTFLLVSSSGIFKAANRMEKERGHFLLLLYHLRVCARPTSIKRDEDVISVAS